ncbi:MAG: hypothetical protein QXO57_02610 [Candidatus Aenigmatarchaeota archaeon]
MLSEILHQDYLKGEKVRKEDLFNKEILIKDYRILESQYSGEYAIVQAEINDRIITFVSNNFMLKQLKGVDKNKFPIRVRLSKKLGEKSDRPFWRFERIDKI